MIYWQIKAFSELDSLTLYRLLQLRVDIFVVEQACPYPELDDKDLAEEARHLLGYRDDTLVAYARILPPGLSYPEASIGRVAVAKAARGSGIARELMTKAVVLSQQTWPQAGIQIGAQVYLQDFYQSRGFEAVSESYLEDGIPHIDMMFKIK